MKISVLTGALAVLLAAFSSNAPAAVDVFNSIPSGPTYNLPSLGYQATQTSEFGPNIQLASGGGQLSSITVGMSNWARESDYEALGASPGYYVPLTLNLYGAPTAGIPGPLFATQTVNALVPWRPENNPSDNSVWIAPDSQSYHGLFFTVNFDFSSSNVTLPSNFVLGVAYNTANYGYSPLGVNGPYNSLNVALSSSPAEPTVGALANPDHEFWNTSTAANYADGGAGGVGIFREDSQWTPYVPAVEVSVVTPEPTAIVAWSVLGLTVGVGARWKRRKLLAEP